mmetsp:Transcript_2287/g.4533  ORF Transcript_2287/g.4533 Transcript_2287/m.4533 type:complete len:254 (-) Transcript_2287:522-1283(-)
MVPENTSSFLLCSSSILSSMVSVVMKRIARTSFVCPIRCALWIACISTAGFHQGSSRNTCEASCRFSPSPPAFSDMRIAATLGSSLKAPRTLILCFTDRLPASLTVFRPSLFSRHSTISSMPVYWENTMALFVLQSLRMSLMCVTRASTLVLLANSSTLTRFMRLVRPMLNSLPPFALWTIFLMGALQMGHALAPALPCLSFFAHAMHVYMCPQSRRSASMGLSRHKMQAFSEALSPPRIFNFRKSIVTVRES